MRISVEKLPKGCLPIYDVKKGDRALTLTDNEFNLAPVIGGYRLDRGPEDPTVIERDHRVVMTELGFESCFEIPPLPGKGDDYEMIIGVRENCSSIGFLIRKISENMEEVCP